MALQAFLIQQGYLSAGNTTGFFGSLTRTAVQKYQCAKGIVCNGDEGTTGYGLVGKRTRDAIDIDAPKTPIPTPPFVAPRPVPPPRPIVVTPPTVLQRLGSFFDLFRIDTKVR